jgi:alpha-mannosidase
MSTRFERVRDAITPATDASQRELPPRELVSVSATVRLSLTAGTDRIDVSICGDNAAGDHRLRWLLPLPGSLHLGHVIADAAFGPVRRDANPRDVHEWPAEERIDSAPLHRWVSVTGEAYGLGVISDGLAEYELLPNGHLAITLVRAVGELSRRDLPERPGHAGWPAATPLAQSRGPFEANFSIIVLPQDADAALAQLEMAADDLLLPMSGDSWRGVATPLAEFSGLTLEGEGLVFSAAKRSEDGEWLVLRCQNQRATVMQGAWHLPRPATDVCLSQLDERPGVALSGTASRIHFEAPPFGIVTLLVR